MGQAIGQAQAANGMNYGMSFIPGAEDLRTMSANEFFGLKNREEDLKSMSFNEFYGLKNREEDLKSYG